MFIKAGNEKQMQINVRATLTFFAYPSIYLHYKK